MVFISFHLLFLQLINCCLIHLVWVEGFLVHLSHQILYSFINSFIYYCVEKQIKRDRINIFFKFCIFMQLQNMCSTHPTINIHFKSYKFWWYQNSDGTSFPILHNASTCAAEYNKRFISLDPGPLSTPFWAVASSKSTIACLFAIQNVLEGQKRC